MPYRVLVPRRTVAVVVTLFLTIIAGSIAYLYLPQASITVSPIVENHQLSQQIVLSQAASEPDFVRYVLPARIVERSVEEIKTFTRAQEAVREDFARGEVNLSNEHNEEQQLLPKTHLRHEATGVFFLTDSPVAIPAGGSVHMRVTAKEKGASGNVPPGKFIIEKLPSSLHHVIFGESTQSFVGGLASEKPLVEAELQQAQEEVLQRARERARGELVAAAGGAALREELMDFEVTENASPAFAGTSPIEFSVRVVMRARGFVIDDNDALSLTLLALRSKVGSEQEFVRYDPDSFTLKLKRADFNRGEAIMEGTLTGIFARKIGPTLFSADNLAGLSESEVQEYFKQFSSVGDVTVQFSPFWVHTVPAQTGSVEIVVKNSNE